MNIGKYVVLGAISVLSILSSCTDVDDTLGGGLILPDQKMGIRIDTLGLNSDEAILTRVIGVDSIKTFNLGTTFMGEYEDAAFGRTWSGFAATFVRGDSANYARGYAFVLDSVRFIAGLSLLKGEEMSAQTFTGYALSEMISRETDTTYYSDFDYENYIDQTKPLFSFKRDKPRGASTVDTMNVILTADGRAYFEEVLADSVRFYDDSLMINTFKGLVIVPDAANGTKDAIYSFPLSGARLMLYTHNYEEEEAINIQDTVRTTLRFDDSQNSTAYPYPNKSISLMKHDYTGTAIGEALDADIVGTAFVQGFGGAVTELEFQDGLFESIEALRLKAVEESGDEDCSILINQAMVYIELADKTTEAMDAAPSRLGMYADYNDVIGIADYAYRYEMSTGTSTTTQTLPYDGHLNRSLWLYKMNITTFIQHEYLMYMAGKSADRKRVVLGPSAYNPAAIYDLRTVALKGSASDSAIKVKLTYTIIYGGK